MESSGPTKQEAIDIPGEQPAPSAEELFVRLVRENKRTVYAVALSRLHNPHDAEDVMQDVFIDAYRKFDHHQIHR